MRADLCIDVLHGKSVLVADDMEDARAVASILLREIGVEVIEAENGREVLDICRTHPLDLIILDVHMPELCGLPLVQAIRSSLIQSAPPILLVTGDTRVCERFGQDGIEVDAYLLKPYQPLQLIDKMVELI